MTSTQLRELVALCAERKSTHLIDLVLRGSDQKAVIEVFIDAERGVTTGMCSEVSREIADALKRNPLVSQQFFLTVSSPGIERPLRFLWQYTKHIGRKMQITMSTETGTQQLTGKCIQAGVESVTLEVPNNEEPVEIAFNMIKEAMVKAPW